MQAVLHHKGDNPFINHNIRKEKYNRKGGGRVGGKMRERERER